MTAARILRRLVRTIRLDMPRFVLDQYKFGCRVGFGRRYALIRAFNMYRNGF